MSTNDEASATQAQVEADAEAAIAFLFMSGAAAMLEQLLADAIEADPRGFAEAVGLNAEYVFIMGPAEPEPEPEPEVDLDAQLEWVLHGDPTLDDVEYPDERI